MDKSSLYVKTDKFKTNKEVMIYVSKSIVELRQVNVDNKRNSIAFTSGFFVSAQEINKEAISQKHNKLWEIL